MVPDRCPQCSGLLDVGVAGPRLAFCRPCHRWWTCGGRAVGRHGESRARRRRS